MVDQTLPEIAEVQSENKAKKRQKDNYNTAVAAIANLDAEHLEKLAEDIDELYERKYGHNKTYKVVLQVSQMGSQGVGRGRSATPKFTYYGKNVFKFD